MRTTAPQTFVLVNADGTLGGTPTTAKPQPGTGQRVVIVPANFGSGGCVWSPDKGGGFVDTPAIEPLSLLDWLMLFTPAERMAIRTKRRSTPTLDDQLTLVEAGDVISLDDIGVTGAVQALVTAKLVTAARAAQILAGTRPA